MALSDVDDQVLALYKKLIDTQGLTLEEVVKSASSVTVFLFDQVGINSVEIEDKRITISEM